eukprot:3384169-Amphidinium_carterae.1
MGLALLIDAAEALGQEVQRAVPHSISTGDRDMLARHDYWQVSGLGTDQGTRDSNTVAYS